MNKPDFSLEEQFIRLSPERMIDRTTYLIRLAKLIIAYIFLSVLIWFMPIENLALRICVGLMPALVTYFIFFIISRKRIEHIAKWKTFLTFMLSTTLVLNGVYILVTKLGQAGWIPGYIAPIGKYKAFFYGVVEKIGADRWVPLATPSPLQNVLEYLYSASWIALCLFIIFLLLYPGVDQDRPDHSLTHSTGDTAGDERSPSQSQ